MNKRKITAAAVSVAAAILFCFFLFYNSAQNADKSSQISDVFVNAVMPVLAFFGIECTSRTVSFYVRKSAHFLGYFALTFLIYKVLKRFFKEKLALTTAPAISFCIALFDEFVIQRNASGRSPEWRDVLIDLCGTLTVILIIAVARKLKKK